jgi:hypothetical protein
MSRFLFFWGRYDKCHHLKKVVRLNFVKLKRERGGESNRKRKIDFVAFFFSLVLASKEAKDEANRLREQVGCFGNGRWVGQMDRYASSEKKKSHLNKMALGFERPHRGERWAGELSRSFHDWRRTFRWIKG